MKAIRLYTATAADSILEGKAAMQIEVKEEAPAKKAAKTEKKAADKPAAEDNEPVVPKVKSKEVSAAPVADKIELETEEVKEAVTEEAAEDDQAAEKKVTKKKVAKKKVTKKKTTKKKVTKKKTTKKKVTKKKVAKKTED